MSDMISCGYVQYNAMRIYQRCCYSILCCVSIQCYCYAIEIARQYYDIASFTTTINPLPDPIILIFWEVLRACRFLSEWYKYACSQVLYHPVIPNTPMCLIWRKINSTQKKPIFFRKTISLDQSPRYAQYRTPPHSATFLLIFRPIFK
mgnify:CR=1 FL=1